MLQNEITVKPRETDRHYIMLCGFPYEAPTHCSRCACELGADCYLYNVVYDWAKHVMYYYCDTCALE